jgi:hypothetical protein
MLTKSRALVPLLAVVYALCAASSWSQTSTDIVRLSYAKLVFAQQVGTIEKYFLYQTLTYPDANLDQVLAENRLSFMLSDFHEGAVQGSLQPLSTLASSLTGKPALQLTVHSNYYKVEEIEDADETSATVTWGLGESVMAEGNWTIGDLAKMVEPGRQAPVKYVTYAVNASYRGQQVSYRAAFLFDDAGNAEVVEPFINLQNLVTANVYPEVLLKHLNSNSAVMQWAGAHSAEGLPSGQVRCEAADLRCLIPIQDIQPTPPLRPPDSPPPPYADCNARYSNFSAGLMAGAPIVNTNQHRTGNHTFVPVWNKQCVYSNGTPLYNEGGQLQGWDCNTRIHVYATGTAWERGDTGPLVWHSGTAGNAIDGTQFRLWPNNAVATTRATVAIQSCHTPICGLISVTIQGIGFTYTPAPYWSPIDQDDDTCAGDLVDTWPM